MILFSLFKKEEIVWLFKSLSNLYFEIEYFCLFFFFLSLLLCFNRPVCFAFFSFLCLVCFVSFSLLCPVCFVFFSLPCSFSFLLVLKFFFDVLAWLLYFIFSHCSYHSAFFRFCFYFVLPLLDKIELN